MANDLLTDLGEEFMIKNDMGANSYDIGLYNDSTDSLSDTSDIGDITTEPANSNYSRVTGAGFTATDLSGDWGIDNDNKLTFDFSDVLEGGANDQDIDTAFIVANFQASDTGDGSAQDHLIANPALTQTRSIGSIDTLEIDAGNLQVKVD